jgi:hypothetical protein
MYARRIVHSWSPALPSRTDFSSASLVALPFVLTALVAGFAVPPGPENWARADPVLKLLPEAVTVSLLPLVGAALAAAWVRLAPAPPGRAALGRAARHALAGAVFAAATVGALRATFGAALPAFVPPEESAGPGLHLNLTAGVGEELLFRLLALPLALTFARRATPLGAATAGSALTGLAFALLHHAGPGPTTPALFLTRFLVPGFAMSMVACLGSPAFIVAAHGTAHLLIPLAFR